MANSGSFDDRLARNSRWLLAGVIVLAISVRMWGIDFGLPYLYHSDEPGYVAVAQNVFKTGDLNPHFFNYPSLFFYINAIAQIPYYLVGRLAGVFQSRVDIPAPIVIATGVGWTPMPTTFLLGRTLTALFGSAVVVPVFLAGQKLTDSTGAGLLAALMTAISPTNVANGRLITPDTFVVFFASLSFWGSVQVYSRGKLWHYVAAGVAAGLTASAKYNGALIVFSLVLAHFLRFGLRGFGRGALYLALLLSAIVFFLTTPYAVLDHQEFLADLKFEAWHYSKAGHAGMEGDALRWYLVYLWDVEGLTALLAVLEALRGVCTRSRQTVLLSFFPMAYFAFISSLVVRNDRTLLPATPFLFLLASSLLVNLLRWTGVSQSRRMLLTSVIGVLISVSLIWPALQTVRRTIRLVTIDSRETARKWINHNLPSGSRIAVESYAPYVDPQRFSVQGFARMIEHTPEWYAANDFEYLVFSEGTYRRFYRAPDRYASEVSQYEELFNAFGVVKIFADGGYEVRIYQTDQ